MAEVEEGTSGLKVTPPEGGFEIGPDLYVVMVDCASLKEQDVNAQVMQPAQFDRLTENIKERAALESLPYTHQPYGKGPISIISGHHRFRAARAAGLRQIPVILDVRPMARGEIISKQIAHNELHGNPDEEILRQLVNQIDNVDDLLRTGLPEDWLPTVEKDDTNLQIPHAEFDWRLVALTFLPKQMTEFSEVMRLIEAKTDLVGVADMEQFEQFAKAVLQHGRQWQIKSMSAALLHLARQAGEEVQIADMGLVDVRDALGFKALKEDEAAVIRKALEANSDDVRTPQDVLVRWAHECLDEPEDRNAAE